ncbi:hypothetical protein EXIGLDRAFT_698066 [Exidia glandulosa HHB12029]|uniref:Uncharacterized protein n=1 Tax=Exidia glandulosa HHB12029 TaxID=1314781 RepID=A0A165EH59_EXIGL|nr:hypothetical protein EXIGLDRAFT_698066 [Exidia glandulosa HHB12029]
MSDQNPPALPCVYCGVSFEDLNGHYPHCRPAQASLNQRAPDGSGRYTGYRVPQQRVVPAQAPVPAPAAHGVPSYAYGAGQYRSQYGIVAAPAAQPVAPAALPQYGKDVPGMSLDPSRPTHPDAIRSCQFAADGCRRSGTRGAMESHGRSCVHNPNRQRRELRRGADVWDPRVASAP